MSYLKDYLFFNSGNECPRQFHLWSALSLLAATLNRGVRFERGGYFVVRPNIYVALVGTAGSGKSTAKDCAKTIFLKHFPGKMFSASIQSREDIIAKMGTDECIFSWTNPDDGKIYEYRPFYLIINELANFMSVDPRKMIDTMVDIFDTDYFSTGFKSTSSQVVENPYVNVLACVQPEWFMNNLKQDLFSGGLGRRLIIVFGEKERFIPNPTVPEGGFEALERVISHLKETSQLVGKFVMDESGQKWWDTWYSNATARINKDDPILKQFHETKHIMVLKVAMLLALCERPFKLVLEEAHLSASNEMLGQLEPNVLRLTSGIGRNVLAAISVQVMDMLLQTGEFVTEKQLMGFFYRQATSLEILEVLKHLEQQDKIKMFDFKVDEKTVAKRYIATVRKYEELARIIAERQKPTA